MAFDFRGQGFVNPEYYGGYGSDSQMGDHLASKKRKLTNMTLCVDHIRGHCTKGPRCSQIHADHIPSLDEREFLAKSKFCHDFQNRGICSRDTCRFLHVTRREEDEFLLTGTIPQAVFNRARERPDSDNPSYSSFSDERPGGRGMRSSGRPGYPSRPPPRDDYYSRYEYDYGYSYESDYHYSRWEEELSHPHRRRKPLDGAGVASSGKDGYSYSQPVTYGNYCIDYMKNTCKKGKECQLVHVSVIETQDDRDAIIKNIFCHDFLNSRCPRAYCKYLHATYDEQKMFREHGFFPDLLCDRNKGKLFFCDICIDHLKTQCGRGSGCQRRHVDCVENKDERICLSRSIFCHDYQESSCTRSVCKLIHTNKGDEELFLETGLLPKHLCSGMGGGAAFDPSIEAIAETVCRDFMKGVCNRGMSCKFYHPRPDEARRLVAYQRAKKMGFKAGLSNVGETKQAAEAKPVIDQEEHSKLKQANEELKQRVQQLERLLADACHCITLAVGDQNPAIQTLKQTIAGMTPESALTATNSGNADPLILGGMKQEPVDM